MEKIWKEREEYIMSMQSIAKTLCDQHSSQDNKLCSINHWLRMESSFMINKSSPKLLYKQQTIPAFFRYEGNYPSTFVPPRSVEHINKMTRKRLPIRIDATYRPIMPGDQMEEVTRIIHYESGRAPNIDGDDSSPFKCKEGEITVYYVEHNLVPNIHSNIYSQMLNIRRRHKEWGESVRFVYAIRIYCTPLQIEPILETSAEYNIDILLKKQQEVNRIDQVPLRQDLEARNRLWIINTQGIIQCEYPGIDNERIEVTIEKLFNNQPIYINPMNDLGPRRSDVELGTPSTISVLETIQICLQFLHYKCPQLHQLLDNYAIHFKWLVSPKIVKNGLEMDMNNIPYLEKTEINFKCFVMRENVDIMNKYMKILEEYLASKCVGFHMDLNTYEFYNISLNKGIRCKKCKKEIKIGDQAFYVCSECGLGQSLCIECGDHVPKAAELAIYLPHPHILYYIPEAAPYSGILSTITTPLGNRRIDKVNMQCPRGGIWKISTENAYEHVNVKCSCCGIEPIIGVWYKCINCLDYGICAQCQYALSLSHHVSHLEAMRWSSTHRLATHDPKLHIIAKVPYGGMLYRAKLKYNELPTGGAGGYPAIYDRHN